MRVKMKTTIAGPNLIASAGQVITVSPEQGKPLIDGGYAEAVVENQVKPAEKIETATAEKREKAVAPPVKKRKR